MTVKLNCPEWCVPGQRSKHPGASVISVDGKPVILTTPKNRIAKS